jgi:hypothetical protein
MKWIKASKRMPDKVGETYFVRLKVGSDLVNRTASTLWKDGKHKVKLFVGYNRDNSHFIMDNVYEWLDESPSPDNQDELWREVFVAVGEDKEWGKCLREMKSKYTISKK